MRYHLRKYLFIILMSFIALPAFAQEKEEAPYQFDKHITGGIDFLSNYIWRGASQTNNGPAVQALALYNFDSGIYFGLWGSNVNFDVNGKTATVEIDNVFGAEHRFNDDWNLNVYLERYNYPKVNSYNYNEVFTVLTYKILTATISYSEDEFATDRSGIYYELALSYDIPAAWVTIEGLSILASAGYFHLPKEAGISYMNYRLTLADQVTERVCLHVDFTDTNGKYDNYPNDRAQIFTGLTITL